MNPPLIVYPLDLSGTSPANLVAGELHDIAVAGNRAIVPNHGPFFTRSLVVRDRVTNQVLEPGVHYKAVQLFVEATIKTGQEICSVIVIDPSVTATQFSIDYHVLGGDYSASVYAIEQMVGDLELDYRSVEWGSLIGKPDYYPPAPHLHDIGDTYGWEYVVAAMESIRQAILVGDEAARRELLQYVDHQDNLIREDITDLRTRLNAHAGDTNNPHSVTKAQVGLGSVQNYGIASSAQALAGTANNAYMTPLRVREAVAEFAGEDLNAHISNNSNPHNVTKAQVGLGSVQNYGMASGAQASAGTANNVYMAPSTTKVAIDTFAVTPLNAHTARTDNPHAVTKDQVGLGNVANYGVATQSQAVGGAANNVYMTPLRVKEAVDLVRDPFNAHAADRANPHAVTKAQVGLGSVDNYSTASQAEATAGTRSDRFMTPLGVRQAIDQVAVNPLNVHANNKSNPHSVTKAQVGLSNVQNYAMADQAQAQAGTADNLYMSPLRVAQAITNQVGSDLSSHVGNRSNPHNVTKAQVGLGSVENLSLASKAEAEAGTSNSRYMTPLRVKEAITVLAGAQLNTHINNNSNPHNVTKAQVGLGSVSNYDIATQAEAEAGSSNVKYMTPLRVKQAIDSQAGSLVNGHASRRDNPHGVTASQVGLGSVSNYSVASQSEAQAGSSNSRYMTPLRTAQAITSQVGSAFSSHSSATNNPHNVTKSQVGLGSVYNYGIATQSEAQAGSVNTEYMTPLRTAQAITYQAINPLTTQINQRVVTNSNGSLNTLSVGGGYLYENSGLRVRTGTSSAWKYFRFHSNGNFMVESGATISSNGYQPSDRRLKKHVRKRQARALWRDLDFKAWQWRRDNRDDLGVIAQEVEAIAPEYVTRYESEFRPGETLAVDKASLGFEMAFAAGREIDRMRAKEERQEKYIKSLERRIRRLEKLAGA